MSATHESNLAAVAELERVANSVIDGWQTRALKAERALWAVRVLDARTELNHDHMWRCLRSVRGTLREEIYACELLDFGRVARSLQRKESPDAARLAAAEAVWPELPESVRAELGERP